MKQHIGRTKELGLLKELLLADYPAFVAIYGRRRIGKTFLVRTAFEGRLSFYLTGMANVKTVQQLANFSYALRNADPSGRDRPAAGSWSEAFQQLREYLETSSEKKKIIFLDELPWLDSPRSGFLPALEHFWNSWAAHRNDILLVTCGSAASWMIHKLLKSRGGLHNRVTHRIHLQPFTLAECEAFFTSRQIVLDRYQQLLLYMTMGGVPFYLEQIKPGWSADQAIQELCFSASGLLRTEFTFLFPSLFQKADQHEAVIEALAKKGMGLLRAELLELTGLPNAGSSTRILEELEEAGFIRRYRPLGKKAYGYFYQLCDPYCLFYLKWIRHSDPGDTQYWISSIDSSKRRAWSGYAFEQICLLHSRQIVEALKIAGIQLSLAAWRGTAGKETAQIDLVIDRKDATVNLFEMKFSTGPYTIQRAEAANLSRKIELFREATGTRKTIFLTFITSFGIRPNEYASSLVQHDFDMSVLFQDV